VSKVTTFTAYALYSSHTQESNKRQVIRQHGRESYMHLSATCI